MKTKKTVLIVAALCVIAVAAVVLSACDFTQENAPANTYTIQYDDDNGTHQIFVQDGMPYTLSELPKREGYEFLGLFDSPQGGVQYVSSKGSSLAVFGDKKNIVLFARFAPISYTIKLDWCGAEKTGEDVFAVKFDENLPSLPANVYIDGVDYKTFKGWYTQKNRGGTQICDQSGFSRLTLDYELARLADDNRTIYFYAGFETKKYNVNLYSASGELYKTLQKEHGEKVGAFKYQKVGDSAAIGWSLAQNGAAVSDNYEITGETNLYAVAFAKLDITYSDSTYLRITDDGWSKNPYDRIGVAAMTGISISQLRNMGFSKAHVYLEFVRSEINDGYQSIRLASDIYGTPIFVEENLEHGGKFTLDKSPTTYRFDKVYNLSAISDVMYVQYDAHGGMEDDWARHSITVRFVIY